MPTKKAKAPTPYCHVCGSRNFDVTTSTQFRTVKGKRREFADVICLNPKCRHQWWSASKVIRALAHAADKARTAA